ncbi:MarR family winged helix-turn-helix transcriptional regulator [Nitratireductor sp. ZSWI3]|uniref:MarR family winged helix-turn-helix transcriptional regulator n=1 Tax=Nitratireductor sp. ZSWI3 TaxID=2966359 RepID=UPI00214FD938|nr:MarR family transcriptional regulator [Nitratireductor sp. ZSWI3]MCR4265009.1 MarR family transcriptional regulator [Nitratireductor sp. ZSWI3]
MTVLSRSAMEKSLPLLSTAIGHKLRRAQLLVFQDFHETFASLKLRPTEFAVLALIATRPGQKQTEIAEQLSIKRANFVALMDCLENRGLAERRKGDIDRRSHSLHLTEKGERFVEKMTQLWRHHEARIVRRLGGERNSELLIDLLDTLLGSESNIEAHQPEKQAAASS